MALVDGVARRVPDVIVRLGHVDVQQPDVAASLDAIPEGMPVVIVPLLLSAGYHVRVDLIEQTSGRDGVIIAPALGPDSRLVDALLARLERLAPGPDDAVVLAVAGSSDDRANEDCREIGRMLGARLRRDVTVGFLAAAEPRVDAAVARAAASAEGRVVVANYLLAPGYFHDLAVRMAAGAPVAAPLLGDDEPHAAGSSASAPSVSRSALVDIVIDRYRAAAKMSD